ncbi:MAG TPA: tetratricopeptide repeat protein [Chitinophagaceae bacterium]|jgi:tetratricopeptide (TPR) repeat protein|nr:tetratricopeptide repeat protein [Chitinophagaceae bacterium]
MNRIISSTFRFLVIATIALFSSCKPTNEDLLTKGNRLFDEGKYDEAILAYTELIQRNNKLQMPLYNRGLCYYNKGEYEKALIDFNKTVELKTPPGTHLVFEKNPDGLLATEEDRMQVKYDLLKEMITATGYHLDSLQRNSK